MIAGNYSINFYGLQIPSSNLNNFFQIIYERYFDEVVTITNNNENTP